MSFTPYRATGGPSARSSQASTSSSPSSTPFMSPLFSRRASYSSSDDSDDELETPNTSPQLVGLDAKHNHLARDAKGKGKALDLDDLHHINGEIVPFSLLDISEEDADTQIVVPQPPTSPLVHPDPVPSSTSTFAPTLAYPPGLPVPAHLASTSTPKPHPADNAPAAPSTPAFSHVRPQQPSPPSREEEREERGRSRWPRLLWSSQLDVESLHVLRSYHSRVVGGDLPVLKKGMTPREVAKWSRQIERAGL
ncbi:uncharacterized protein JCM15063_005879 [Sporobolomyces koalae]|uniref:uncharacterized protein n=1 Tax=Sporobolomyces koalae TaxID=500713 RepID=UPI0031802E31